MIDDHSKKVLIMYSRAKDFRIIAATGVVGGLSPQGELICNFFVEQVADPGKVELTIDAEGKVVHEDVISKIEQPFFDRELQVGVVMRPDIAKTVGQWLIEQADRTLSVSNTDKH